MKRKQKKQKKLSLKEAFPSLAVEWHPEKNGTLTPDDVKPRDIVHAWWKCGSKHEWSAAVKERVDGAGCPFCPSISKGIAGKISLASAQPEAVDFWHKKKNGKRTPDQFIHCSNIKVWWKCKNGHEWYAPIKSMRFHPRCPHCHPGFNASHDNNLAIKKPELACQWHPTKNGTLLPSHIAPFSSRKVWWRCSKGHEWSASVAGRYLTRINCPICVKIKRDKLKLTVGATQVIPFWHPSKNGDLKPADCKSNSNKKVWWVCEKGHEFERNISGMIKNQNCPVCRKLYLAATSNLQVKNPELAREWHPVKNGDLTPDKVAHNAQIKVWWLCPKGHEYRSPLPGRSRTDGKSRGCPYCAGHKDLSKESLAILHPELAKEWHPKKNGKLTPGKVSAVNTRVVWWRCKEGHLWQASICNRVLGRKRSNCPRCGVLSSSSAIKSEKVRKGKVKRMTTRKILD